MPKYYGLDANVGLSISDLHDSISARTVPKTKAGKKLENQNSTTPVRNSHNLAERNVPCEDGLHLRFLGSNKEVPFFLVQCGQPEEPHQRDVHLTTSSRDVNAWTAYTSSVTTSTDSTYHDELSGTYDASAVKPNSAPVRKLGSNQETRLLVEADTENAKWSSDRDADDNSPLPLAQIIMPHAKALTLTVTLGIACFRRPRATPGPQWGSMHDIKIDVFFNGNFTHSTYINGRHFQDGTKKKDVTVRFAGLRIHRLHEIPWVVMAAKPAGSPMIRTNGTCPESRSLAKKHWAAVGSSLQEEANKYAQTFDGLDSPVAEYLTSLSTLRMPESLQDAQPGNGTNFGVIDVVITAGHGKKDSASCGYLNYPVRMRNQKPGPVSGRSQPSAGQIEGLNKKFSSPLRLVFSKRPTLSLSQSQSAIGSTDKRSPGRPPKRGRSLEQRLGYDGTYDELSHPNSRKVLDLRPSLGFLQAARDNQAGMNSRSNTDFTLFSIANDISLGDRIITSPQKLILPAMRKSKKFSGQRSSPAMSSPLRVSQALGTGDVPNLLPAFPAGLPLQKHEYANTRENVSLGQLTQKQRTGLGQVPAEDHVQQLAVVNYADVAKLEAGVALALQEGSRSDSCLIKRLVNEGGAGVGQHSDQQKVAHPPVLYRKQHEKQRIMQEKRLIPALTPKSHERGELSLTSMTESQRRATKQATDEFRKFIRPAESRYSILTYPATSALFTPENLEDIQDADVYPRMAALMTRSPGYSFQCYWDAFVKAHGCIGRAMELLQEERFPGADKDESGDAENVFIRQIRAERSGRFEEDAVVMGVRFVVGANYPLD